MTTMTTTIDRPVVEFLADWRGDAHRDLPEPGRAAAGEYIRTIVRLDPLVGQLSEAGQLAAAAMLWVRFRDAYDGLRGPFMRSDAEDVGRAMSLI